MADYTISVAIMSNSAAQVTVKGERNSTVGEEVYVTSPNLRPFYGRPGVRQPYEYRKVTESSGNQVICAEIQPRTL